MDIEHYEGAIEALLFAMGNRSASLRLQKQLGMIQKRPAKLLII